jgi:hypothetical protein
MAAVIGVDSFTAGLPTNAEDNKFVAADLKDNFKACQ